MMTAPIIRVTTATIVRHGTGCIRGEVAGLVVWYTVGGYVGREPIAQLRGAWHA